MNPSLNRFLCKWFDPVRSGYVTIGSLAFMSLVYCSLVIAFGFCIWGAYNLYKEFFMEQFQPNELEDLSIVIASGIILFLFLAGLNILLHIRIAGCPLKDHEPVDEHSFRRD